jgi:hypothetical protein
MHVPSMPSVSAPSMPHLSAPHISQMSPPTAQDVANGIGRFGEQHQGQLEKGAWKAGSLGGGRAANKAIDWLDDKADPASLRKAAIAPDSRGRKDLQKAGVDDANAALMKLAASDGDFGNRMLAHLNADHPKLESHQAVLDAAKPQVGMLDKVKAKADRLWKRVNREKVDDVDRSPAIKPSQVARVVGGEAARQRQIDRMGETLPKMTANEDRSWWEQPAPRVRPDPAPKKK